MVGDSGGRVFDGVACRTTWPDEPGVYSEDDYLLDPSAGIAVLGRGRGAIGGQGKPAGTLAVWSVVGELCGVTSRGDEAAVQQAFERANEAVRRLSHGWPAGLIAPWAALALVWARGTGVMVANVGDTRVLRARGRELEVVVGPALGLTWRELLVSRGWSGLGRPQSPSVDVRSVDVQLGDTFLLAPPSLFEYFGVAQLQELMAEDELRKGVEARLRSVAEEHAYGETSLCVLRWGSGPGRRITGSVRPKTSWLFDPGRPLAEPPRAYARGPDGEWFREVFGLVIESADEDGCPDPDG